MLSTADLIVAPATPVGPGSRAIVRLAGENLAAVLAAMFEAPPADATAATDRPRLLTRRLAAAGLGRDWGPLAVDMLEWPGTTGPLGQPLAELQLPASGPLVAAVVHEACRQGCRLARGGEFTLRAFLAGRLDLVQAEAVLAVVDARTPAELATALDRMAAGAAGPLAAVRDDLLDLLADVEAAIDFADETIPDAVPAAAVADDIAARIARCRQAVAGVASRLGDRCNAAAELPRVALAGPPNIGKSTLFNAVLGRPAALVADEQGTTRDWLEGRLETVAGPVCLLLDAAGIGGDGPATGSSVAALAEASGREAIARADVVVCCRDAREAASGPAFDGTSQPAAFASRATPDRAAGFQGCRSPHPTTLAWLPSDTPRLDVITRCDLAACPPESGTIATSGATGAGIATLREAIIEAVARLPPRGSAATERLAAGCQAAGQALAAAADACQDAGSGRTGDEAVVAVALRGAVGALADVTGLSFDTDLLDRIFSRHCIGK